MSLEKCGPSSYTNDLLMISLSKFYSNKQNINKIIPIITGKSDISLRLMDWFVTNYSKKTNSIIPLSTDNNNICHFNVYLSYRSQLKAYSKQQFDPFRRRDRINFYYDKDKSIETTIGQLNFFRWVIENKILEYIEKNIEAIENDMVTVQKKQNQVTEIKKDGRKRLELSKSVLKNMNTFTGSRVISFN
jgi:hypothetical protein